MTILQSIILGIVQGLTEFIPVSSSGHLVLVPHWFGWDIPKDQAFVFDVLVQVATLGAVFAYFWSDLIVIIQAWLDGLRRNRPFEHPMSRLGWYLILATIPAGLVGLFFREQIAAAFDAPKATGGFLLLTAILLLFAERFQNRQQPLECMTWQKSLLIGIFQAVALLPGVSRSGATITGGMTAGLHREAAARFSFLMSIPIMLAAGLGASLELADIPNWTASIPVFSPGLLVSAVVGYLVIRWLLRFLAKQPLYVFSLYCAVVGVAVLVF